jgi:alkyl sulfatase BDS1-like metallo-beta-lactamase superfamily hydrolase
VAAPAGGDRQRYVSVIGSVDATVAKAQEFADEGDLRFAAQLASHAVFAEPGHDDAKTLLTQVLTRLGFGAECATWRNCFLLGAQEVQGPAVPTQVSSAGMATALSVTQLFDSLAIRIDGERAWNDSLRIRWQVTDSDEAYWMELSNGALVHHPTTRNAPADLTVSLTRGQLLAAIARGSTEGLQVEGDPSVFTRLLALTEEPAEAFAMVTP